MFLNKTKGLQNLIDNKPFRNLHHSRKEYNIQVQNIERSNFGNNSKPDVSKQLFKFSELQKNFCLLKKGKRCHSQGRLKVSQNQLITSKGGYSKDVKFTKFIRRKFTQDNKESSTPRKLKNDPIIIIQGIKEENDGKKGSKKTKNTSQAHRNFISKMKQQNTFETSGEKPSLPS